MNKKLATFFICSFIALVNSTPIDSADNEANLSTGSDVQYEVTPLPTGTMPPSLVSHRVGETSHSGKSDGLPSTATGTSAPQAVSFVSQPDTTPSQNASNATVTAVTVPAPTVPITKSPIPPIPTLAPTLPTLAPTVPTTTNTTDVPTTPTTTLPPTTTTTVVTTTTTTPGTTNSTTPPTPITTSGTTPAAVTTTPAPAPTAAPSKDRRFDGPSFIGGIVLSLGIMAIAFVAWKFYKARTERNYHTL